MLKLIKNGAIQMTDRIMNVGLIEILIDIYTSVIIKITNRITAKIAEKEKEIIEIIFVIFGS